MTTITEFFGVNKLLDKMDILQKESLKIAFQGAMLLTKLATIPELNKKIIETNDDFDSGTMNDLKEQKVKFDRIKDNRLRYKIFLIENFKGFVEKYIQKLGDECKDDFSFKRLVPDNERDAISLMRSIPTLDVRMHLIYDYIANQDSKWHINDARDIAFLTAAIPYADVIVTERKWCGVARKYGFESKYNTEIISNFVDLETIINS